MSPVFVDAGKLFVALHAVGKLGAVVSAYQVRVVHPIVVLQDVVVGVGPIALVASRRSVMPPGEDEVDTYFYDIYIHTTHALSPKR
jgi:hypothetical protein